MVLLDSVQVGLVAAVTGRERRQMAVVAVAHHLCWMCVAVIAWAVVRVDGDGKAGEGWHRVGGW